MANQTDSMFPPRRPSEHTVSTRDRRLAERILESSPAPERLAPNHYFPLRDRIGEALAQRFREGREEGLREALRMVPTNWCDPLLTGDDKVFDQDKRPEPNIEAVLLAIRERIKTLLRIASLDQPAPEGAKE